MLVFLLACMQSSSGHGLSMSRPDALQIADWSHRGLYGGVSRSCCSEGCCMPSHRSRYAQYKCLLPAAPSGLTAQQQAPMQP